MSSKSIRITTLAESGGTILLTMVALLGAVQLPSGIAQEPAVAVATQKPDARIDPSETDIELIRAGSEVFVAAFNKHDAEAVAALWTEDGEYIDDTGRTIAGRDAIAKDYSEFFTTNPDVEIQIVIDSLRVISGDIAIEDGRAIIDPSPPGAPGVSKYTAVHAKVDGKWLMASVRDTWMEVQVTRQSVADLGWLIGTWTVEEHGVRNESVCRWVANEQFIERRMDEMVLLPVLVELPAVGHHLFLRPFPEDVGQEPVHR